MTGFIIALQVLAALFLVLVVLLQPGNRGGATAALGGSGSATFFGGRGANTFLSKLTVAAAVVFMFTNLALSRLSGRGSVLDVVQQPTPQLPAVAAPKDDAKQPPAASDSQAAPGSSDSKKEGEQPKQQQEGQ
ncbi:MAG: preprotein translocase subunit SecG [Myxococcota bacterium]